MTEMKAYLTELQRAIIEEATKLYTDGQISESLWGRDVGQRLIVARIEDSVFDDAFPGALYIADEKGHGAHGTFRRIGSAKAEAPKPVLTPTPEGQDYGCAWCDTQADRCASKACAEYQAALEQRLSVGGAHDCEGERLSVRRFVDAKRKAEVPAPTCSSCGAEHCARDCVDAVSLGWPEVKANDYIFRAGDYGPAKQSLGRGYYWNIDGQK